MKIAVHSDLHIDRTFPNDPLGRVSVIRNDDADVIVLAGDISDVRELSFLYVKKVAALHPKIPVIFVAGNHDHWNNDLIETEQFFRENFDEVPNAHYLENDFLVVKKGQQTVVFYGCTYWSDFELTGKNESGWAMLKCQKMPDFGLIKNSGDFFSPQQSRLLCKKSKSWFEAELSRKHMAQRVVVSHFPIVPTFNKHPDSPVTAWFGNDHGDLITKYSPDLVVAGHTHNNIDVSVHGTRLISNQAGYQNEHENYRRDLVVEI